MRATRVLIAAFALLLLTRSAASCSQPHGYFHQVTHLAGTLVGMTNEWPFIGYKSYPGWLRHSVTRANARLHLHEYRWPIRSLSEAPFVASAVTNKSGRFDFGTLPEGHYILVVDWPTANGNRFDIELKRLDGEISSITIDLSPVDPDCRGGHEFIVRSEP